MSPAISHPASSRFFPVGGGGKGRFVALIHPHGDSALLLISWPNGTRRSNILNCLLPGRFFILQELHAEASTYCPPTSSTLPRRFTQTNSPRQFPQCIYPGTFTRFFTRNINGIFTETLSVLYQPITGLHQDFYQGITRAFTKIFTR